MASIYFAAPYRPIMCGIGDYTEFLTRKSPSGGWGVLSFNLSRYGGPLISNCAPQTGPIWYGIPDRQSYSSAAIQQGLDILGADRRDSVVWFQHEFGIWPNQERFIAMLKSLDIPSVVTFHTIHFQSTETKYGLRTEQYEFLSALLPYVNAITVFSRGVYGALGAAFPEYIDKIHVIKHGIHHYPEVSSLTRREAKEKLNDYLLYDSDLDSKSKKRLHKQHILLDPDTIIIGQTGFLSPAKGSELLYTVRDSLERIVLNKRIVALRIGTPRDKSQEEYTAYLQKAQDSKPNFLLKVWLPQGMLPVAQRAFDINFYWPVECTQSGVLAHALGAGAVIASRDIEGVGETLKDAGAAVDSNMETLISKMKTLITNPELAEDVAEKALYYAEDYSWENQVRRHYELAGRLVCSKPVPSKSVTSENYRRLQSFPTTVEQQTAGGYRYN
jgi:glycosyltransferase involved in cell wall biosynthesis